VAPSSLASSGPCKLQSSEHSVIDLQPGSSHSFTLPAMHSLGQLQQLLLEIDSSTNKVGMSATAPLGPCLPERLAYLMMRGMMQQSGLRAVGSGTAMCGGGGCCCCCGGGGGNLVHFVDGR